MKALILQNINNQISKGKLTSEGKKILSIKNIEFINFTYPKEDSLVQFGSDSIYYEDINGSRHITAEFSCRITVDQSEGNTMETNGIVSFIGKYDFKTKTLIKNDFRLNLKE